MHYSDELIRRTLTDRLTRMYGQDAIRRALRNLATDLIGATDPADLPADCRAWVERAIDEASEAAAKTATEQILVELATRFAAAPDDLQGCQLMQAVAHAQAIHVTEVR